MKRRVVAVLLLVSSAALAQELELDISGEAPAPPAALRPSIAVLAVQAPAGDEPSKARASLLEAEVLKQVAQSERFGTVFEPSLAARSLQDKAASAVSCTDYACFDAARKALKAHRLVRFTVTRSGSGSVVTMLGFDPGLEAVLTRTIDSQEKAEKTFAGLQGKPQVQKDRDFVRKLVPTIKVWLTELSTPNGTLSVDNVEQSAVVRVDGEEVGTGTFETVVQRGRKTVSVTADGYLPFSQDVVVEPGGKATVKVTLVARPIERVRTAQVEAPHGPPIFQRPGLYVAIGGALLAGGGIALGQSAAAVDRQLAAGGDPVPVTRAQAKAAATQALLANVLVAVGAAAVVGGAVWVIVTPAVAPRPTLEPGESNVSGATLTFGGQF